MADYLTRTFSRTLNQLLLLFGGILLLAFLLCVVATGIRSAGASVMGRGYYYLVAPGVVCHETGHALGCLLTGTKIVHFEPFRMRGNELGHVVFRRRSGNILWSAADFVIGTGPIWFGCFVIVLLTKLFSRSFRIPDFKEMFPLDPCPSSGRYWLGVCKAAGRQFLCAVKVWKWKSTLNVVYLYLIFCIASEMTLSPSDFSGLLVGLGCLAAVFLILNVIPPVGVAVSGLVFRSAKILFPVHATMVFVLFVDFLLSVLFVWPLRFFVRC